MTDGRWQLLKQAKNASARTPRISALQLLPVYDPHSATMVPSWRRDGVARDVSLHGIVSRVGGFPSALARYFIAAYTSPGDTVLDPFCGKGTALLEAARLGRHAIGGDVAPDAVVVSRAKCNPVSIAEASNYVQALQIFRRPAFSEVPKDVSLFFDRRTLDQILSFRKQILRDMVGAGKDKKRVATFVCAVMLGILHGHSKLSLSVPCNQCFAMSPNYVRRYVAEHGLKKPQRNVKECLLTRTLDLLPAPRNMAHGAVFEVPAQDCHSYAARIKPKPTLVMTSPPYLNRQTYAKDAWLRLWFLGRPMRRAFPKSLETGSPRLFVEGMIESLCSMWRAMKPRGHLVLVCGKAGVDVGSKKRQVRIGELCLLAVEKARYRKRSFDIEAVYSDRILMKRGSYFAVHSGQEFHGRGKVARRYGEDEIVVLKKVRPQ